MDEPNDQSSSTSGSNVARTRLSKLLREGTKTPHLIEYTEAQVSDRVLGTVSNETVSMANYLFKLRTQHLMLATEFSVTLVPPKSIKLLRRAQEMEAQASLIRKLFEHMVMIETDCFEYPGEDLRLRANNLAVVSRANAELQEGKLGAMLRAVTDHIESLAGGSSVQSENETVDPKAEIGRMLEQLLLSLRE